MSKEKRNRLPYRAEYRNALLGIRRGERWKVDSRGRVKQSAEHPSEVYPAGKGKERE